MIQRGMSRGTGRAASPSRSARRSGSRHHGPSCAARRRWRWPRTSNSAAAPGQSADARIAAGGATRHAPAPAVSRAVDAATKRARRRLPRGGGRRSSPRCAPCRRWRQLQVVRGVADHQRALGHRRRTRASAPSSMRGWACGGLVGGARGVEQALQLARAQRLVSPRRLLPVATASQWWRAFRPAASAACRRTARSRAGLREVVVAVAVGQLSG